ncbi:MAG: acetylxylan esterase [Ferruginibacter sp.]|nr:acetylxylan esterase [Ferruginibacter sp.]
MINFPANKIRTALLQRKLKVILSKPFIGLLLTGWGFSHALMAQSADGWRASSQTIEKLSKEKPEINYYEEKVPPYNLPDVLTAVNRKKITTATRWMNLRRPEILELFRENVHGRVPATPYQTSFRVINLDTTAINGTATFKQVAITIIAEGQSLIIHLNLFTPNNAGQPVPTFLLINNRGLANMDQSRKVKSEFWPVEEGIARGYGMAVFNNADVDPDNFDEFKNGVHGLLDKLPRTGDAWGTIAAWAWGASRCLDYLVTDRDIAGDKVAVVGHSRGGKTALWAGAEDTRFAMVISSCSGNLGSSIARRHYGETIRKTNAGFPHWFSSNLKKFNDNENALPVDMHMLLALTAPRALYISCAGEDLWADPYGSYLALYHAVPVFNLLGAKSTIAIVMPSFNKQTLSGKVGFHIRDGIHNMVLEDWKKFMDFADAIFGRKL